MKRNVSKNLRKASTFGTFTGKSTYILHTQAQTHTQTHTYYFKLIVNVEKLKFEAYFKSLQDQINMRINIKPFYFLIKDIDWPYGRDGLGVAD